MTDRVVGRPFEKGNRGGHAPRDGRYIITEKCSLGCSLNPRNLPGAAGAQVHRWFEEGDNNLTIVAKSKVLGLNLSNGAIGRHYAKHMLRVDPDMPDPSQHSEPSQAMTDLEVLEKIIQRGAQSVNLATSRVSTEQLLKAIDLKHKMTQGSVFEALFGAFEDEGDAAMAEDAAAEAEEAVRGEEEAAQALPVDDE